MTLRRFALPAVLFATLLVTGCASHYYAPPPPGYGAPPLVERADREGFRMGSEDGARDAYNGRGYHPKADRRFRDTPGYDPAMGPYPVYRDNFRNAYLRGYNNSFNRR